MQTARLCVALLLSVLVAVVLSDPWNTRNDPGTFDSFYPGGPITSLDELPTTGSLSTVPWADTYWPSYLSGIAYRFLSDDPQSFNYSLNTKAQLQAMSLNDLVLLSPAGTLAYLFVATWLLNSIVEKYDIYVGRYDYPTVNAEWQRTSPQDEQWEGICHGYVPLKEPSTTNSLFIQLVRSRVVLQTTQSRHP